MRMAESLLAYQRGEDGPDATAGALHMAEAMLEIKNIRTLIEGIIKGLSRRR